MLMRLSAISSLLLAFAISSCGWFDDYELAFNPKLSDGMPKITVEVREKGKTDKVADDAAGHDLKITLSLKCGEDDAKEKTKDATKGRAEFTVTAITDAKSKDCEVEATADDAKSAEGKFKTAA